LALKFDIDTLKKIMDQLEQHLNNCSDYIEPAEDILEAGGAYVRNVLNNHQEDAA
jgi:hypothetical protein